MIKSKIIRFKTCQSNINKLYELLKESARCWNDVVSYSNIHELTEGGFPNRSNLHNFTKGNYNLLSQSTQAVYETYLDNVKTTRSLKKNGYNKREYPYKEKECYPITWKTDGIRIMGNSIFLSLPVICNKRSTPIRIKVSSKALDCINIDGIKQVKICYKPEYDKPFYMVVMYDDCISVDHIINNNICRSVGIDMGEIHNFACFAESGNSLIVTGRKQRSIKSFRTELTSKLRSKMSKCKPGSRQHRKYEKSMKYIARKSNNQLKDLNHKSTREVVNWCLENNVKDVHVGDLSNMKSTKKKLGKSAGKISSWERDKLLTYLNYKLEQSNINMNIQDESYTSQTCPVCNNRKKTNNRNFLCSCGFIEHRDILGARNILSKALYNGEFNHFDVNTSLNYIRL